ncbi:hypothetical protein, partial [Actinomadura roseirufa]|uniref:hypothetical protein n=1 Tax=Actinomadura roseirufa TaxID=2094049 RepID=UPI001A956149
GAAGAAGAAGAGAGAGAAGSAGSGMGAAGTAGTSVSKGFLATAAGKGTLAVAGVAVVAASATAAVYATKGGATKTPRTRPVAQVNTASQTQTIGGVDVQNAAYVSVSGLGDAALEKRVNQELRAPLDRLIRIGTGSAERGRCGGRQTKVFTTARTGLRGPRYVSVRYFMHSDWCQQADGAPGGEVVTVDLTTGKRLTNQDVFRPGTLTPAGVARLQSFMTQRATASSRKWSDCSTDGRFERADFFPQKAGGQTIKGMEVDPPRLSAFFTPAEFQLSWLHAGSDGCGDLDFGGSYASVRDLLKPEIAALLPK